MSNEERDGRRKAYWHANLKILGALLSVWFLVSYGCGILFADYLDQWRIPGTGFKLGFWFAQQGSIYVFFVLIGVYVILMNRRDRKFGLEEVDDADAAGATGGEGAE